MNKSSGRRRAAIGCAIAGFVLTIGAFVITSRFDHAQRTPIHLGQSVLVFGTLLCAAGVLVASIIEHRSSTRTFTRVANAMATAVVLGLILYGGFLLFVFSDFYIQW